MSKTTLSEVFRTIGFNRNRVAVPDPSTGGEEMRILDSEESLQQYLGRAFCMFEAATWMPRRVSETEFVLLHVDLTLPENGACLLALTAAFPDRDLVKHVVYIRLLWNFFSHMWDLDVVTSEDVAVEMRSNTKQFIEAYPTLHLSTYDGMRIYMERVAQNYLDEARALPATEWEQHRKYCAGVKRNAQIIVCVAAAVLALCFCFHVIGAEICAALFAIVSLCSAAGYSKIKHEHWPVKLAKAREILDHRFGAEYTAAIHVAFGAAVVATSDNPEDAEAIRASSTEPQDLRYGVLQLQAVKWARGIHVRPFHEVQKLAHAEITASAHNITNADLECDDE